MDTLDALHRQILNCTLCPDAGYIEQAAPVVAVSSSNGMMLIGQAPGITELQVRRPFQGRAGKELFRWMASIGIGEDEFRSQVYMTAITKCFPGKTPNGSGDRRPSTREIELCRPWLEQQLALLRPRCLLLVGGLAIERYFPKRALTDLIGTRKEVNGVVYIPLPHPSGASRWLNDAGNKALLRAALLHVAEEWNRLMPGVERRAG
ncbi:MAG: uracil-DNA glycosylase family protein [Chloroflexota bacterium]